MDDRIMWLPTPIYERMPVFWFLLGLLFGACALYIGLDSVVMFGYAGLGLVCWCYSVSISIMRRRFRGKKRLQDETVVTFV